MYLSPPLPGGLWAFLSDPVPMGWGSPGVFLQGCGRGHFLWLRKRSCTWKARRGPGPAPAAAPSPGAWYQLQVRGQRRARAATIFLAKENPKPAPSETLQGQGSSRAALWVPLRAAARQEGFPSRHWPSGPVSLSRCGSP